MSLKFFNLISEATPTTLAGGAVAPSSASKIRAARSQNASQQPVAAAQTTQQNPPQARKTQQPNTGTSTVTQPQKVDINKRVDEIYNNIEQEIQDCFSSKNRNSVKDPIFLEKVKWLFLLAKSNTTIKR